MFVGIFKLLNKILDWAYNYKTARIKSSYTKIHPSVKLGNHVEISGSYENIEIGEGTYINHAQIFAGDNSKVIIGENCAIGYRISIKARSHALSKVCHDKNTDHHVLEKDISIGNRCWIGDGVYIKEGVVLGDDVVVGANSVVTKSFGSKVVIGGVPAKIIKKLPAD